MQLQTKQNKYARSDDGLMVPMMEAAFPIFNNVFDFLRLEDAVN